MAEKTRGNRKKQIGIVVSDKMEKTVTVSVSGLIKHPLFKKYIMRSKKYRAHDEANECRQGDKVLIEETRPLSKSKCWKVKQIIERAV